jgi:hypothetical protein
MDTTGEKEKRMSKKNLDRRTSSHDDKKFGTRSMEKQRGKAFGFWKTATAVTKPDRWTDRRLLSATDRSSWPLTKMLQT